MGCSFTKICINAFTAMQAEEESVMEEELPVPSTSLVCIEREANFKVCTKCVKDISVLQTLGSGMLPRKLDKDRLVAFREALQGSGIDTNLWGCNGAKSVEHLFWEAFEQRGCLLVGLNQPLKQLKRVTRLVKIKLVSEIYGVDHALFSRMQFMHDGQNIQRKQVIVRKLQWTKEPTDSTSSSDFAKEECGLTEDWRECCYKALQERFGLPEKWQHQNLQEEAHKYAYTVDDNVQSDGYPGLNTLYCIHQVTFRVLDPERATCLGLPQGQEFATSEADFRFQNMQQQEDGLPIGSQLNIWTWEREQATPRKKSGPVSVKGDPPPKAQQSQAAPAQASTNSSASRRVPLPVMSAKALETARQRVDMRVQHPPSGALWAALNGQKTDWAVIKRMAKSIMDPKYSLRQFHEDLGAFPELHLYLLEDEVPGDDITNSGRSKGDEYQRTVGAFFAIYWLMRLEGDGKDGFTCGVDDNWSPIKVKAGGKEQENAGHPMEKRANFQKSGRWDYFRRLLLQAGLIEKTKWGGFKPCERRVVSLLALTAIHDIMKMDLLLPQVQQAHAPYHGYQGGNKIGDHDTALAYVMEWFPQMLPSFMGLNASERQSVRFTQCNLCFNHGWFVQAEAPPGAVFTKFRQCLTRDHPSTIGSKDVALYFVHWLTDLAGAEPTPLGGCEKFVLKFPLHVLNSFLRSFEFVEKIVDHTETEVMEQYLTARWNESIPGVGPLPTGRSAVARMRLLCMAQMNAPLVLKNFSDLSEEDQTVLCAEMSLTGCIGQSFSAGLIPKEVRDSPHGPSFLIYYGPAFFQNLGNDRAVQRLGVLAEIYRCARQLWPASIHEIATSVIVRIDAIKSLSIDGLLQVIASGDLWLLVKHNESEAFIERASKRMLNQFIASGKKVQIVELSHISNY